MFKNKYYSADDVDDLFVLMNGIFVSVADQAKRTDKALTDARAKASEVEVANQALSNELALVKQRLFELQEENETLATQLAHTSTVTIDDSERVHELETVLRDRDDAYSRLAQSSSDRMAEQQAVIDTLSDENSNKDVQIMSLHEELKTIASNQNADLEGLVTTLQNDYDVLQYKYETLKTLSAQKIQELKK